MARISIYLPDDLKGRMDEAGDEGWSRIAQIAFETHLINRSIHMNHDDIDAIAERLWKSRDKAMAEARQEGHAAGRQWAAKYAEYYELEAVTDEQDCVRICRIVLGSGPDAELLCASPTDDDDARFEPFWDGFQDGAIEIWNKVQPAIEATQRLD